MIKTSFFFWAKDFQKKTTNQPTNPTTTSHHPQKMGRDFPSAASATVCSAPGLVALCQRILPLDVQVLEAHLMGPSRTWSLVPQSLGEFTNQMWVWFLVNCWLVVSNIFYFHPYLGKWSNLTNISQMGWNQQLVFKNDTQEWVARLCKNDKKCPVFSNRRNGVQWKKIAPPTIFQHLAGC